MLKILIALIIAITNIIAPSIVWAATPVKVIDGAWFDGVGNEVFLHTGAFKSDPIKLGTHTLSELIALFDDVCLKAPIGTKFARPAIAPREGWGFAYLDADAGTTLGARLDGWQAPDVTVNSEADAWPLAVCNVFATRPNIDPTDILLEMLDEKLLAKPNKQVPARRSDGRPMDGITWRWDVIGPNGRPRRVYASVSNRAGINYLHLGVTEATTRKRR